VLNNAVSDSADHPSLRLTSREAIARLVAGETQAHVARSYAVDPTTIGRLQA
jgi:hypothetical protein